MDKYIDNLMSKMTVEQKIGQLNLHSAGGFISALKVTEDDENIKALRRGEIGALYGSGDVSYNRQLQEIALESGAGIPLIFGMDVIHGYQTIFPVPLALSTSWNMDLIERTSRAAAKEASASGINWVFSPMVDIARDARWGRIVEGAGEDPYLGGEIAKAYVYGYQGHDDKFDKDEVLTCVKHYALYGGAEAGRDYNSVFLSRQEAMNGFMRPYAEAAKAGAASYMSSFNEFEGIPASANKYLLTDVLRDQFGFNGFVVSDATAVQEMVAHGIGNLQEVSARALQAGLDMDMNSDGFVATLKKSLDEKRISKKDIDIACRRVLEAKYKLGLFEDPFKYLDEERAKTEIFTDETRALAREAANESQVLLKNNGILPLKTSAKVAVIGPFADDKESMSGAWAMSKMNSQNVSIYQGIKELSHNIVTKAEGSWMMYDEDLEFNVKYGLMATFMPGFKGAPIHTVPQERLISEALAYARNADVIVACVGESNTMNGEGASRSDISLPDAQEDLLKALKSTGKPIVMVLTTGRPLVLNWEEENMDAILVTWSEGSEAGHSIADVLYGNVNPSGKLTTSFPRSVGQEPLYYNHKNTGRPHPDYDPYKKFTSNYMDVINAPLYPFGYGLSYTTFEYSPIKLSSDSMREKGKVKASVEVKNTGNYDGMETVQLYIHDCLSTSTRPVKELKGFQKIFLKAGEKKKVEFEITAEDLKYYNHELEYVCEPGDFEIFIGPDSQDLSRAILTLK
ncbi:MAG: beta-glucosidase BglX [Bacteroidales bacterium]|nr:beta-glucosidase BglX [Bacteroidales bacterium]